MAVLRNIEILSSLKKKELDQFAALMKKETYTEGETLFNEGDAGDCMFIVLSGSVSITVNLENGDTLEIAEITEGNFFGEMSIFDSVPRSATCSTKANTQVMRLKGDDFYQYIRSNPEAGIKVMHRMLEITSTRLQNTGAFLSDMVTWGEQARTRAITDDFTGLYNRRFLDDAMEDRLDEAKSSGHPLSVVMVDLDHFGTLNNEYGQKVGDNVILEVVPIFKQHFTEKDILARYGGDEFTFVLSQTPGEVAQKLCTAMIQDVNKIDILSNLNGSIREVTASVGVASFPDHGGSSVEVRERADQALYQAKELGRNRAVLWKG
jgi:diguanylate cyclase (GGDEF)-like protein